MTDSHDSYGIFSTPFAREAFNAIAEVAFRERTASKIRLQKLVYYDVRERFGLPAQLAIRAISKVCEAYKRDK